MCCGCCWWLSRLTSYLNPPALARRLIWQASSRKGKKSEAWRADSRLLWDCRSRDGRRVLRRYTAKYLSAPPEFRSHWLPPSIGELVSPCVRRTAGRQRTGRLHVSRQQTRVRTADCEALFRVRQGGCRGGIERRFLTRRNYIRRSSSC